jgi:murein tripeptide amidase MpaA
MYRTVAQLDFLGALLAAFFPQHCSRFQLPETSVQGRPVYALRLRAGSGENRRGVLLVAGTHSRELMNPDLLIELAIDLIVTYRTGNDLVLGGTRWSATDIKVILETLDLYLVPCINPDGRHYVMTVDDMWRKNRRDNPGTTCDGVDLNRNLDLLWGVTEGSVSCWQCADTYCGPAVFSEPETRNVKHLLDTRRIDCFADVHSYSELLLYPWGHAPTQTTDPSRRFTTLPSGNCQPIADATYAEYMTPRDLQRFQTVAGRIVTAIAGVRGHNYTPQPGIDLYPTTGTHSDYAYSRHIANSSVRKTYGYTFETGPWQGSAAESFHPADPEPVKREAESGLLALIQQCICAIELIGARFLDRDREVDALRRVRDELLGTTEAGRQWIALFERVQTPLVVTVLEDEELSRAAAELLASAGTQITDESAVLQPDVAERAQSFVEQLGRRSPKELHRDLNVVQERITASSGRATREIIQSLMERPPHE